MKKLVYIFLFLPWLGWAQTATLRGQVRDARGQGVPYASVVLPELKLGATADGEGQFALAEVPLGPVRVQVSAVGFEAAEQVAAVAAGGAAPLLVRLRAEAAALTEVVVTGVSRATEIRRSPVPIAALGKREISLNANSNIIDAAVRGVPGLTAVTTGPNISKPFIRGLGYNRVLTMYNGLRQEGQQWGDEHGVEVDGYDVERVEVVKGPASLLYGSDAVAGVVNLLPALPRGPAGELHGEALTEYQSNNGLVGSSVGLNYNKNGWLYGLRASRRQAHNYRNAVDGYVFGTSFRELNLTGVAGLEKKWGASHWFATLYDNAQEIPDGSRDSLSRRFTRQVADGAADDLRNRPLVGERALRGYGIGPLHQRIQHYRLFTRTRLLLGERGGELNLLLGVQHNHRREYVYPTAPAQTALAMRLTTTNYDLRYHLPTRARGGLETTVGLNGMAQQNRHGEATDFAIPAYNLLDVGGYALVKKPFGAVEVSGGLRYDVRQVNWADFWVAPNPATGFEGAAAGPQVAGARQQFAGFRKRYAGVSASLGGAWLATERLTVRGNLARGYRAPNIPEIGSNGLDPGAHIVYLGNRSFGSEFSLQQDVGVVWHDDRLDASVEVFHNQVSNYIFQGRLTDDAGQPVVDAAGNLTYQFRQGAARLFGLETSLAYSLLPSLRATASAALVEGRNEDERLRREYGAAARYLPLLPPVQGRAELRATRATLLAGTLRNSYLRLTTDLVAAQNRYYAVDNTETRTAGYGLLGLGAGTTLSRPRGGRELAQVFVQVDNILDAAYQSHLNRLKYFEYYQASPTGRLGIFNPGRNVGVKVVVPF